MIKKLFVSFIIMNTYTLTAYAAGEGDSYTEKSSGLPQLDPSTYASQIFWLFTIFIIMYVFFAKKSLPDISQTIEKRSERINNDLNSADQLKQEVKTLQSSYEENLNKAHIEVQSLFTDVEEELKTTSEKNKNDFQQRSIDQISDLEKKIEAARNQAMNEMESIAIEVATNATEKIIGVQPDEKTAAKILKAINNKAA